MGLNSVVGREGKTLELSGKIMILYNKIERNLTMKNFRQHSISVQIADGEVKTRRKTDETVLKKNPKIDVRLLEEYERLVAASGSGVRARKQGADYNIAHPLARKDMPTDAYHRGERASKTGRSQLLTRRRR